MMTNTPPPETPTSQTDPRLRELRGSLKRVQMRFRLREAASLAPLAVSMGLAATALLAVVWRLTAHFSLPMLLGIGVGLVCAALLTVGLYALLRPRDLMSTARHADRILSLDERLSTALEDAGKPVSQPEQAGLRAAQLEDAVHSVGNVSVERDLPVELDRRKLVPVLSMLALLVAVVLLPNPIGAGQNGAAQAQVGAEQKNIEVLKQAVQANPRSATDPKLQELLKELQQLSQDLSDKSLSREDALAHLSDTESKLQKALDPQASAQREALDQMAKQLAGSQSEAAKKAGEALKSGDPQKAADALKKAGENADKMSPQERKALAESLKQARDSVAALDPELAQRLNEASEVLQGSDPKAAQEALKNLSAQVGTTGQNLATQQQVQQALAQIQQSKSNIAQAGQPTPAAGAVATGMAQGTAQANGTPLSGTPAALASPGNGTPIASLDSPVSGTAVALGSPVSGTPAAKGTPVLVQGTPGAGTPVAAQGQGQTQGTGQQGQSGSTGQPGQGNNGNQGQGQGQGQGAGANGNPGGANPSGGWGKGHEEPVYAPPSSVNAPSTALPVQGQNNPGGEQSSTTTNTDANNTGPALVPYEQVYGQYQQQAGNALGSDYIPQGYKDLVRDYFTEIQPQSQP